MQRFMQNTVIAGTTGRGSLNLYSELPVERAWALTHKVAVSNRVYRRHFGGELKMARDGTNRGGARVGAGAKRKPLSEKIAEGNPGKRELTVIDFDNQSADLEGQPMPKPSRLLSAKQKDGKKLIAADIYKKTWEWLQERNCSALVSPDLLERYAMSAARWIQCEEAISEFGFLAKHPTTGNAIQSPYVAMSQNFMSQTNRLWMEIYQIVKDNCASEYSGVTPMDDTMELLLRARKGN
jgi:hypothetical protein